MLKQLVKNLVLFPMLLLSIGFNTYAQSDDSEADMESFENQMKDMRARTQNLVKELKKFQGQGDSKNLPAEIKLPNGQTMKMADASKMIQGHYRNMSVDQIEAQLRSNVSNGHAKMILERFPKLLNFAAHFLKDEKAMPGVLKIYEDREKLKKMGLALVATFFLSWVLGFILIRAKDGLSKRFFMRAFRFVFIIVVRVGIVLHFFGPELKPTIGLVKRLYF